MLPTIEEAKKELEIASQLNPGPWIKHSLNVGIAARNIAQKIPELNEDKACILGVLHDIGRRVGIVNIPTHVYEGYKYCVEKGWDEVAKICMTHSYPLMQEEFNYEPSTKEEKEIKQYITKCHVDDYDKLIQICDALATDYGFVILEEYFEKKWGALFMMYCLISVKQPYYVHRHGNRAKTSDFRKQNTGPRPMSRPAFQPAMNKQFQNADEFFGRTVEKYKQWLMVKLQE